MWNDSSQCNLAEITVVSELVYLTYLEDHYNQKYVSFFTKLPSNSSTERYTWYLVYSLLVDIGLDSLKNCSKSIVYASCIQVMVAASLCQLHSSYGSRMWTLYVHASVCLTTIDRGLDHLYPLGAFLFDVKLCTIYRWNCKLHNLSW